MPRDVAEVPGCALLLENEHVRVFREEIPARHGTPIHWHEFDSLVVPLENGEIRENVIVPDRPRKTAGTARVEVRARTVAPEQWTFTRALVAHQVNNLGTAAFHSITVELKQGAERRSTRGMVLRPGEAASVPSEKHPLLYVVLGEGELSYGGGSEAPRRCECAPGSVLWIEAGTAYALRNVGNKPVSLLVTVVGE